MARRRTRREHLDALDPLGVALMPVRVLPVLSGVEDRRQWHPEGVNRPVRSISHRSAFRSVVKSSGLRNDISFRVGFDVPSQVVTCIRRKRRREVIHALNLVGKGSGARLRRRNWRSDIDCT